MPTTSSTLISLKACNLTLIRVPPQEDEKDWWDFEEQGSIEAGGTAANQIRPVRATGQLLERDIVQIHSLETATYNGHYGTLQTYIEEKQRWQVKLDKNDKVIVVKAANLSFIREPHIKPLPGSRQVQLVLDTLQDINDCSMTHCTLQAHEAARSLLLGCQGPGRKGRAEFVFYCLGIAHQRLGQNDKAIELYRQQVEFVSL